MCYKPYLKPKIKIHHIFWGLLISKTLLSSLRLIYNTENLKSS